MGDPSQQSEKNMISLAAHVAHPCSRCCGNRLHMAFVKKGFRDALKHLHQPVRPWKQQVHQDHQTRKTRKPRAKSAREKAWKSREKTAHGHENGVKIVKIKKWISHHEKQENYETQTIWRKSQEWKGFYIHGQGLGNFHWWICYLGVFHLLTWEFECRALLYFSIAPNRSKISVEIIFSPDMGKVGSPKWNGPSFEGFRKSMAQWVCVVGARSEEKPWGKELRGSAVSHSTRRSLVTRERLLFFMTCDWEDLWNLIFW